VPIALNTLAAPVSTVVRPYTSGTISPSANALVLVMVSNTGSVGDTSSKLASNLTSTFAINGSWAIQQVADPGATSRSSIHVWWAVTTSSPGSGTVTINTGASPAASHIAIVEFTGIDTTTPMTGYIGPVGSASATGTLTLTAAPTTADVTYSVAASRNDTNGATAGSGMTLHLNAWHASPSAGLSTQQRTSSTSTSVPYAGLGTVWNSVMAFNVKVASGVTNYTGTATVSGTATNSSAGVVGKVAAATLAATAAITAAGTVGGGATNYDGTASIAASSTITTAGVVGKSSTASIAGTDAVTAAGVVGRSTTAAVAGTSTITTAGAVGKSSSATLAGSDSITAAGSVGKSSGATLAATGSITAAGTVTSGSADGATYAGTVTITAAGSVARSSGASLAATSTVTAAGSVVSGSGGNATVAGNVTIVAGGSVARSGAASLPATATLTATGTIAASQGATLAAAGTITAAGSVSGASPDVEAEIHDGRTYAPSMTATLRVQSTDARVRLGTTEATIHTPTISGGLR
jgi:fibronectin-binding autotransporter adhesin